MRFHKPLIALLLLSNTACGLLEEHLASAVEKNVVPSAVAEVFSSMQQNFTAVIAGESGVNLDLNICSSSSGEQADPCTGGSIVVNLTECQVQDPFSFTGELNFTFLDATDNPIGNCQLDVGDRVERIFNASISGYDLVDISLNSNSHHGIPASGTQGSQILTKDSANTWSFQSTGSHRVGGVAKLGVHPLDLTTYTTEDFEITNTLSSPLEITPGVGKIQLRNRALDYTIELGTDVASPLVFNNCSCPTSGTLSGTAVGGSANGSTMNIEFTQCGLATFTFRGVSHENVQLDMCTGI